MEAVKLLIGRGAQVCYMGKTGFYSLYRVPRSEAVRNWLLVGRFNDQKRIKERVYNGPMGKIKPWSGVVQARHPLHGFQYLHDGEASINYLRGLAAYKLNMRGKVVPYIDGYMRKH
jgi:hypothetical protein